MANPAIPVPSLLILLAGASLASAASAQDAASAESPAHARARSATSSLNGGPAQTTLTTRPNAAPPLTSAERPSVSPSPPPPRARPSPTSSSPAPPARQPPSAPSASAARTEIDPATGQPEAIALPLGYYVRGDKACNQVWPGEGDLAWLTPTSFTIDFGGCEPGQFVQTGPNAWRETQACHTELGGDAGGYDVTYELIGTGTLLRRARLALDGRIEQDLWAHCERADVPVEARFKS